jgi:hypothetical protein
MARVVRERPRRTGVAAIAVIVVLALGWLAGSGADGSAPQPRATTVVSTAILRLTRTVIVASDKSPRRARAVRRRAGRSERRKQQQSDQTGGR